MKSKILLIVLSTIIISFYFIPVIGIKFSTHQVMDGWFQLFIYILVIGFATIMFVNVVKEEERW